MRWSLLILILARLLCPRLVAWWRRRDVARDLAALAATEAADLAPPDAFALRQVRGCRHGRGWTVAEVHCELRPLCPTEGEVRSTSLVALAVPLPHRPRLCFALTSPGASPEYHEREWRRYTQVAGSFLSLRLPALDRHPDDRDTGGSLAELTDHAAALPLAALGQARVSSAPAFDELLTPERARRLREAAAAGLVELNVTPTSVNALARPAPAGTLQVHLDLLLDLATAVEAG